MILNFPLYYAFADQDICGEINVVADEVENDNKVLRTMYEFALSS